MGQFNPEERLARGEFPEVEKYLQALPREELEKNALSLALYGKALLARGDYDAALALLEPRDRARGRTVRRRARSSGRCRRASSSGTSLRSPSSTPRPPGTTATGWCPGS